MIIRPIITEKTLNLSENNNQYTFSVGKSINKFEVKKLIQDKFNVTVENVRILNVLGKTTVFGKRRIEGKRSDMKKAIVTLKKGDKIGLFNIK